MMICRSEMEPQGKPSSPLSASSGSSVAYAPLALRRLSSARATFSRWFLAFSPDALSANSYVELAGHSTYGTCAVPCDSGSFSSAWHRSLTSSRPLRGLLIDLSFETVDATLLGLEDGLGRPVPMLPLVLSVGGPNPRESILSSRYQLAGRIAGCSTTEHMTAQAAVA